MNKHLTALTAHCFTGLCGLMHAISLEKRMRQLLGALHTAQAPGQGLTQHCNPREAYDPNAEGNPRDQGHIRSSQTKALRRDSRAKPSHRGWVRAQASDSGFEVLSILHSKCPRAEGPLTYYHPVPCQEFPSHNLCFWWDLPGIHVRFRTN